MVILTFDSNMNKKVSILILAAGNSNRLGQAKQMLQRGNETMIQYIYQECIKSQIGPVYIITGAYHEAIEKEIPDAKIIFNPNWEEGMSTSISCGIKNIEHKKLSGVIIVLSDQVYFNKSVLTKISAVALSKSPKIINCTYQEGMGPPTYFDKSLFPVLAQLSGDEGAKSIVRKYISESIAISFPKGHFDLDTPEDLDILNTL